jgi:hypothetical protein
VEVQGQLIFAPAQALAELAASHCPLLGLDEVLRKVIAALREQPLIAGLNRLSQFLVEQDSSLRPFHFIEQCSPTGGLEYARSIESVGAIPTRQNMHDLCNALTWLIYPRSKWALIGHHGHQEEGTPAALGRGSARDAATLLDESGVFFVCSDEGTTEALRRRDWQRLFIDGRRALVGHVRVLIVGHGLLTKLVQPYKSLTAHALILDAPADFVDWSIGRLTRWTDKTACERINRPTFDVGSLSPLPVMGLPGWCEANQHEVFYCDPTVFRASRFGRVS